MESATLRYRPHIDGLRGVAVISVILFHAFPGVFHGGLVGVDIFFVISGFLISSILYADFRAPASSLGGVISNFYARRVRRIFPSLIIVLVACFVAGFLILTPGELERLSLDIAASTGFCLNFLLARRSGYFDASSVANPVLHLWSLAIEEQFYLAWPLVIWIATRCRMRILPVAVFLAAFSFFWNGQRNAGDAAAAFYLPQMRLWELLIGAVAAALHPLIPQTTPDGELKPGGRVPAESDGRRISGILDEILSVIGVVLIGAGLVTIRGDLELPDNWTLLPTFGAAFVVCSGSSAWFNRRVLSNRVMVWIGLISYPLYLWHWPLLSLAQTASEHPISQLLRAAVLAASVILAWLTYKYAETPVRRNKRSRGVIAALAGTMAAIAGFGYISLRAAGYPSRFPRLLNEIFTFNYDPAGAVRQGTYFLMGDRDESYFPKDPNEIRKGRPTIYLWGDSHAAALYPGLNAVFGKDHNIVQRTAAKTPPFMPAYFNPGNAQHINRFVLESIQRDKPDAVVLEANWPGYEWQRVEETIFALKEARIRRIVLVGPVPQWIGGLPQQLLNYARWHRSEPVPVRMSAGLDPEPVHLDSLMQALSERLGVEYVSPCKIMGNQDGFLVRTGDTPDSLTTLDQSHLTVSGSVFLVSHFPKL
jgi:peptidoglycan/LPS O-acetylase OafA/YrhL